MRRLVPMILSMVVALAVPAGCDGTGAAGTDATSGPAGEDQHGAAPDTGDPATADVAPAGPQRVPVAYARERLLSDDYDTLLVCAYTDEELCNDLRLEGALTLAELQDREPGLAMDREIIFYCT